MMQTDTLNLARHAIELETMFTRDADSTQTGLDLFYIELLIT